MLPTRLAKAGQTPIECWLGFYDFSKSHGPWLGPLGHVLSRSRITHVGPILKLGTGELAITITTGGAAVHRPDVVEKHNPLIASLYLANLAINFSDAIRIDILFDSLVGRFIGLTPPRICTTFASRVFGLPLEWYPATLYRRLKNDYDSAMWTGPRR